MSTKIWEAYRIPRTKLIEFTDILHDGMFNSVVEHCEALMDAVLPEALEEAVKGNKLLLPRDTDLSNPRLNKFARLEFVLREAVKQAKNMERSIFALDCGFNIWLDRRYAYIIPIANIGMVVTIPEWAKDFHYQNQTDPPKDVPPREWRAREQKWEKLCLGEGKSGHNARRFHHSVIYLNEPDHIPSIVDLQFAICSPIEETFKEL